MSSTKQLLSIIELGGYPDFVPLYKRYGYAITVEYSMRKALTKLKKLKPEVIVCEFNYQSDFRDRTSTLESLIAVAQRDETLKVIVFYEQEYKHQFAKLSAQYKFFAEIAFPIEEQVMEDLFKRLEVTA